MLEHLLFGGSYAFAAAIQPGPLQAFLVSRVAASGWRRTLPASVAPLLSDGPIALVALVLLGRLSPVAQQTMQAAGGCLLIYLAWSAFMRWRRGGDREATESAPRTLVEAVVVNLLNPNPYLGWTLVLGPAVHAAWQEDGAYALGLVAAFYLTMVATLAAFILLVGTAGLLGAGTRRKLVGVSAGILAALGAYLLVSAVWRLAMG